MDLRRFGEFAFGAAVVACAGAFLVLAVVRLNAPVAVGLPATSRVVAAASQPTVAAATAAPAVAAVRRSGETRIAGARRPSLAIHAKAAHHIAARPHPSPAVIVAARPSSSITQPLIAPSTLERPLRVLQPEKDVASVHPRAPGEAPITPVHRPAAMRSPMPRMLAIANGPHRSRTADVRGPKSERTPEPPIGYDDHPALLRSDGPSAAMPSMEPVQVELTTKNLGR